jgi:integrase
MAPMEANGGLRAPHVLPKTDRVAMKLTEKNTSGLSLKDGKLDHVWWDDDIAGFGIRVREGGTRNWIFRYRIGKKQRSLILGSATSVPLSVARKNASALEARVRLGEDPALDRQTAKLEADNTFGVLAAQYLDARKSQWRFKTHREIVRHLNKYAKPLHRIPITALSQRDIANLQNSLAKESGDVTANRLRASLTAFLGWVIREGIRLPEGNVASYTNKREEKSRDRVLSDAELKAIWTACPDNGFGAIVKLLILTAQRKTEIGSLRWDEVHDEQIVLPSNRTKNERTHVVPLSDPAQAILNRFRANGRNSVFGRQDTGFQDWTKAKIALDARAKLEHWTLHDLRRTVATRMAELGVQPHIVEAVLNHVSGHKGGVAGIYNRATYDKEKREALNLWAEHVTALVEGRKSVVVSMRRA